MTQILSMVSLLMMTGAAPLTASSLFDASSDSLSTQVQGLYDRGEYHKVQGRLDSAKIYIEKAVTLAPHIAELHLALARILYMQGNIMRLQELAQFRNKQIPYFDQALSQISLTLKIAPENIEGLALGTQLLLEYNDASSLQSAEEYMHRVLSKTPHHLDAQLLHTELLLRTGSVLNAHALVQQLVRENPDDLNISLMHAKLTLLTDPTEEACEQYLTALSGTRNPVALYHELAHVIYLLPRTEQQLFQHLPQEDQGQFITAFWRRSNPEPYALFNRRLVEHLERVHVALSQYPRKHSPGYDDRGFTYIQYGHPHEYFKDSGSPDVLPNQSWVYRYAFGELQFDFVLTDDVYHTTNTLQPAVKDHVSNKDVRVQQLYYNRKHLGGFYLSLAHNYGKKQLNYAATIKRSNIEDAPVSYYQLPYDAKPIIIWTSDASYRNPDGSARYEIHYAIPSRSLPFSQSLFGPGKCILTSQTLATNTRYQPVYYNKDFLTFWLNPEDSTSRSGFMLARQTFTLNPGNYHLNMGLKTLDRQKRAVHSDTIHIPDYSENRLQLSPLQFSIRIEKPDQVNPDLPFHGYQVYTYPMHAVVQKTPLYLYSEIYGLKQLTGGMSRYNIQCEIQPVEIEQNFTTMLSKLFNHYQYTPPFIYKAANQVDTNSDFIYTPLDLSKVPIGWNTIHLAVTDEVSGETFVRSQLFEVATAEDFQAAMQGITNRRERSQRFQPLPSRRSSIGRGRRGGR